MAAVASAFLGHRRVVWLHGKALMPVFLLCLRKATRLCLNDLLLSLAPQDGLCVGIESMQYVLQNFWCSPIKLFSDLEIAAPSSSDPSTDFFLFFFLPSMWGC